MQCSIAFLSNENMNERSNVWVISCLLEFGVWSLEFVLFIIRTLFSRILGYDNRSIVTNVNWRKTIKFLHRNIKMIMI